MMILKVRGPEEGTEFPKTGETYYDDWWVFECYKIHYHKEWYRMPLPKKVVKMQSVNVTSVTSRSDQLEEDDEEDWGSYIDGDVIILEKDVGSNPRLVIVAHLSTEENQDYVVVFDTIAYLCNDKGETIEKIEP